MLKSYALAVLSGLLYVFSFAPWDQSYLAWIAFFPLLLAVEVLPKNKNNFKSVFLLGFVVALMVSLGGFYWILYATQEYGGLPLIAALPIFVLFCVINQLQIPIYLLLRRQFLRLDWISPRLVFRSFAFGILYAGIEAFYPKLFLDTVGNAFSHSEWIRQVADLGGPFLLTVLLVSTSELISASVRSKRVAPALIALLIPVFSLSYGFYRTSQYENLKIAHKNDPAFNLALIQANIGDYLKVAAEKGVMTAVDQVIGKYLELSQNSLKPSTHPTAPDADAAPDAIVWPETAYPAVFQHPVSLSEGRLESALGAFTRTLKPYLIFGGYDVDSKGLEYNSIFFYEPTTQKKEVYHKNVLLTFGETLPFADEFPSMKDWFPTMGFFGRGPGPSVVELKNKNGNAFKFAPSICYEGLFSDYSVQGALLGADALLNVTNDSWFGPDGEPDLHLALTNFRSIETRLPMLRSTNTGITVWMDPLGHFVKTTGVNTSDILEAQIQTRLMPAPPFLVVAKVLGGNWFVRLVELLSLIGIVALISKRKSLSPL